MAIIGFNFTKLHIERQKTIKGKINIHNNVSVTNVEPKSLELPQKKTALKISFEFKTEYKPDIGTIEVLGNILYLESEDEANKIIAHWKKNKNLQDPLRIKILDNVLEKCNIQAILLSREIGLPAPIPLPKVNQKK